MAVNLTVTSTPTTVVIQGLCACVNSYNFVVSDNSSNIQVFPVTISSPLISAFGTTTQPSCLSNCNGQMSGNLTGASVYTIVSSQTSSAVPAYTTSGSYTIGGMCSGVQTLSVFASGGCSTTITGTVGVKASPTVIATSTAICEGSSYTISPSGASTYSINGGSFAVSPTITSSYSVTGTNSLGCQSVAPAIVVVTVNPLPLVYAQGSTVCANQSASLSASSSIAVSYNWSGPLGFSATSQNVVIPSAQPATSGIYSVVANSTAGCTNQAICSVSVVPVPAFTISSVNPPCAGQNLSVNVTPIQGASFNWTGPNSFTANAPGFFINNIGLNSSGIYTLIVIQGPCLIQSMVSVAVLSLPSVSLVSSSSVICAGETITLTASGASNFTLGPGSFTNVLVVSPLVSGVYTVTGAATNGCTNTAVTSLSVNACLSINDLWDTSLNFNIYPNPYKDGFFVNCNTSASATLFDGLGRIISQTLLHPGENFLKQTNLPAGIYLLAVEYQNKRSFYKLIKE